MSASATPPGTASSLYNIGSGGLPDLSSLFGGAMTGAATTGAPTTGGATTSGSGGTGLGAMGFGSPNIAEMQRQVCRSFSFISD